MATESDNSAGKKADKKASRLGLPFEPGRDKKKASRAEGQAASDQATAKGTAKDGGALKSSKKRKNPDQVSARAQAKADEILARNRQKAKEKSAAKGSSANRASKSGSKSDSGAIPEAVSQRMLRRMAVLSGAPVFLGVGIFFLAYYLRSRQIVEFPPVAVLLVTMGCFGLGVLGLTYGVLSASWDPEPGGLVGLKEFKLNIGRVMDARRASKT